MAWMLPIDGLSVVVVMDELTTISSVHYLGEHTLTIKS